VIAVDVNHFLFEGDLPDAGSDGKGRRGRKKTRKFRISRRRLVDMDRISASLLRRFKGVDMTILESVRKWKERFKGPNIVEIMLNSAHIKGYYISKYMLELNTPEVVIAPRVGKIKLLEFHRASEAIEAGYMSTMEMEDEIFAATGITKKRGKKRRRRRDDSSP